MDSIFVKPVLASEEFTVGEQVFTLYELSGDVYHRYIITADAMRAWDAMKAAEQQDEADSAESEEGESTPEEPDYETVYYSRLGVQDGEYRWIACSLQPGYPDKTVEELEKDLKLNLSKEQRQAMFNVAIKLNNLSDPKEDTPESDSSTD